LKLASENKNSNIAIVKYLIAKGADITLNGYDAATTAKNSEIIVYFNSLIEDKEIKNEMVKSAIRNGDFDIVVFLIENNFSLISEYGFWFIDTAVKASTNRDNTIAKNNEILIYLLNNINIDTIRDYTKNMFPAESKRKILQRYLDGSMFYTLEIIYKYSPSELDNFISQFTNDYYKDINEKRYMTLYYLFQNDLLSPETEKIVNHYNFNQILNQVNTAQELRTLIKNL